MEIHEMLHCTQLELYIRSLNPTPRYTYNVCNELGMKRFLELLEYKKIIEANYVPQIIVLSIY